MEKVKLTREQANAIEYALQEVDEYKGNPDRLLRHASMNNVNFRNELHLLDTIDIVTLAKALYIGYEVEPEFEKGDFVVWYGEVVEIKNPQTDNHKDNGRCYFTIKRSDGTEHFNIQREDLRHATPSEIAEEKERRFWNKFGREVNEYRAGDIVKGRVVITKRWRLGPVKKTPELEGVVQIEDISDGSTIDLEMESCRLICPVENRLDREGE